MHRSVRLLAELYTKDQNPSLPGIIWRLLAKQRRTWQHRHCLRFNHLSRWRNYFQLVFFHFCKLAWVAHQNPKGKPFPFHSSDAQKQALQGTKIRRCSTLANSDVSTIASLDTHSAAACHKQLLNTDFLQLFFIAQEYSKITTVTIQIWCSI